MAPADIPLYVSDYLVFPLTFKPCEGFPDPIFHYLYFHPHNPKIPTPETPRSLFLVNIPIDTTELHIKHLFSTQLDLPSGRIESVDFEGTKRQSSIPKADSENGTSRQSQTTPKSKKRKRGDDPLDLEKLAAEDIPPVWDRQIHKSGSTAVVLFVDRPSMEAAFKAAKKARKASKTIIWGGDGIEAKLPSLGSARYITHNALTYPPKAELLASVNKYMTAFAANEAAQAKARAKQRQEPDEDGFVKVTRGGKGGRTRGSRTFIGFRRGRGRRRERRSW